MVAHMRNGASRAIGCYVTGLCRGFGEYENLDELNYLAARLDEMSDYDFELFEAVVEVGDCGEFCKRPYQPHG